MRNLEIYSTPTIHDMNLPQLELEIATSEMLIEEFPKTAHPAQHKILTERIEELVVLINQKKLLQLIGG